MVLPMSSQRGPERMDFAAGDSGSAPHTEDVAIP